MAASLLPPTANRDCPKEVRCRTSPPASEEHQGDDDRVAEAPDAALAELAEGGVLGHQVGGGALVGEGEQQTAGAQEGGEGDDEGRHVPPGDEESVEQADAAAHHEGEQQRGEESVLRGPGGEDSPRAKTEPTERSMPPVMMTIVMPRATTARNEAWMVTPRALSRDANVG